MSIEIAKMGLRAAQDELDVISNNTANVGTKGFKASRANFFSMAVNGQPAGVEVGSHTQDMTRGITSMTGSPMDVALQNSGFFTVQEADGSRCYTRLGQFAVKTGFLVDNLGRQVLGLMEGDGPKPIKIKGAVGEVCSIQEDGSVVVENNGKSEIVATLAIAHFPNENGLQPVDGTSWISAPESGNPSYSVPLGKLIVGGLEGSNVKLQDELISLMAAQRNYQANSKVLSTENQTMQTLLQAI